MLLEKEKIKMKTRLSEKAKTRLREERMSPDILKTKSDKKKEKTLNPSLKNDHCEEMKKDSLEIYEKNKNKFLEGDVGPLETGKKLMILKCINCEDAMKGNDFVFTVHYVDSVENLLFDSVLLPKETVDSEMCTNTDSSCIKGMEHDESNENPGSFVDKEKLWTSKISDVVAANNCSDSGDPNKELENDLMRGKQTSLDLMRSKKVVSLNSSKKTTTCNSATKGTKENKSPQAQNEIGNKETGTVKKSECLQSQRILITTSDVAKSRPKSHSSTPKSLKRNLKDEFTDAIHQSKGERRYIVEVACSNGLSSTTNSAETREVICNGEPSGELSSSAEDTASEKSTAGKLFKNNKKKQVSGKEITEMEKTKSSDFEMSKGRFVEEKKSPKDRSVENKKTLNDRSVEEKKGRKDRSVEEKKSPKDSSVEEKKSPKDRSVEEKKSSKDKSVEEKRSSQKCVTPTSKNKRKSNVGNQHICGDQISIVSSLTHFSDSENSKEAENVRESSKLGCLHTDSERKNAENGEILSDKSENTSPQISKKVLRRHKYKLQTPAESQSSKESNEVQHSESQFFAEKSQKTRKENNKGSGDSHQGSVPSSSSAIKENSISSHRKSSRKRTVENDNDIPEPKMRRSLRRNVKL